MFKNILLPTDGSELSEKAAQRAVALANLLSAKVVALHVVPANLGIYYGEAVWVDDKLQLQLREAAQAEGNKYLDRIETAARAATVPCERALPEAASPWKGIVETAESKGCDLIVMAAHGRRGLAAVVLGSETNRVLMHSTIPVLVYR